ncbi:hypothetical protein WJX73_001679 [Symbiochloris irregularis]|uniref:Uncharacterized protein n=1 Tax=Symbiochloris irregularis TaxID=706552 RepID=A0AAW1PZS2_9CHLO
MEGIEQANSSGPAEEPKSVPVSARSRSRRLSQVFTRALPSDRQTQSPRPDPARSPGRVEQPTSRSTSGSLASQENPGSQDSQASGGSTPNSQGQWFSYLKGKLGLRRSKRRGSGTPGSSLPEGSRSPDHIMANGTASPHNSPVKEVPQSPQSDSVKPEQPRSPSPSDADTEHASKQRADQDYADRRKSRVAREFRRPLPETLNQDEDLQPGKRRSESVDLPTIPERSIRRSLEGNRWSLPSEDSRPSEDSPRLSKEARLSRDGRKHATDPAGRAHNPDAMTLGTSDFSKRTGRREQRVARRSEAIDRAFAQASAPENLSDFLPTTLEERSTLFAGPSHRGGNVQRATRP